MKGTSYRDRDYAFGETMLALRDRIGLTQAGLANLLHVSRRAVSDWESGNSYPKAEHLKQLITLGIEQHAFQAGHEVEEIHELWHKAHQKVLLDKGWLSDVLLLSKSTKISPLAMQHASAVNAPRVDWGDALATPNFYGRGGELRLLTEWIVDQHCRVVSVLGLGGIGKSALAVTLMHQVAKDFDVVIWRSLRDLPSASTVLDSILQVVAPQTLSEVSTNLERRLSFVLESFRNTRVLVVLDNLESMLQEGEGSGHFRPGYEGIGRFLQLSAETEHQSCVLVTSREKPIHLIAQEGNRSRVRALRLAQLDVDACAKLLTEKEVKGSAADRTQLIEAYAGNPLALKIVTQTINDLFDGEIASFLEHGEIIFGSARELLTEQFARLSALEQSLLLWLAILREPATLDELMAVLAKPVPRPRLLEAVEALYRRSLIERGQKYGSFTLQSVVLEYATAQLIAEASDEILNGKLARLIDHGLELAQAREYVRQTQERLILAPILTNLNALLQQAAVEDELAALLNQLRTFSPPAQGYGPANLVALLRLERGDLRGLDLSQLALRSVYLQGVEMQDASLSGTLIRDSVFTETFDDIMAVAISSSGAYWATSSRQREIRVLESEGLTLRRAWQAHDDLIWSLAFSPDEQTLISGSWDGTIKLWDIASGTLLWSARHGDHMAGLAFAPDGSLLATSGPDAAVRLWDAHSGKPLQALPHPHPLNSLAWSPDGAILASGDTDGGIYLWTMRGRAPASLIQTLAAHTQLVDGLAFAPDSRTLASASWDGTVRLWEMPGGQLRERLIGHNAGVRRVTWSPDGRFLASCGFEKTIWLWDAARGSYYSALRGHAAELTSLAFTPDGQSLLSGSEDGAIRLWEVTSGQCVRVVQGYSNSLGCLDWSPDGTQLVSGGADRHVTIYSKNGETPPRVLGETGGVVLDVGWSPDGRFVAGSEWGHAISLWSPASERSLRVLRDPDDPGDFLDGLAWSPDGKRLACGSSRRGVVIFEMTPHHPHRIGKPLPLPIRPVSWSPDGTQVAGGGNDGAVYVWDSEEALLLQRLPGHYSTIMSVAWSPDGRHLASSSSGRDGGELFIWDIRRGERVNTLAGHPAIVTALTWGQGGELLVSGGADSILRWWDVQHGECVLQVDTQHGKIPSLKTSPDGTMLASCGDNGAIMLWNLKSGEFLQTLRRDRPYERLNITGIQGLTEAQKATLSALGAIEGQ